MKIIWYLEYLLVKLWKKKTTDNRFLVGKQKFYAFLILYVLKFVCLCVCVWLGKKVSSFHRHQVC